MAAMESECTATRRNELSDSGQTESQPHWTNYYLKASALCVFLYASSVLVPALPPLVLAAFWAILSLISAISPLYTHVILRKTTRHQQLQPNSAFYKLNNGRIMSIIVSFAIAAACSLTLILQTPGWEPKNWLLIMASIFIFPAVYKGTKKIVEREYTPFFRQAHIVRISCIVVTLVLVLVNVVLVCTTDPAAYVGPVQAVLSVNQPFENSPSVLISDLAWLSSLIKGLTAYGLSAVSEISYTAYQLLEIIFSIATFYSFACLFGVCWLSRDDVKTAFAPIREDANASVEISPSKRYVALAILLPIVLFAGSVAMDAHASHIEQSGQVTQIKTLIRSAIGFSVDTSHGTYYDHALLEGKYHSFAVRAKTDLSPLIIQAYQTRIGNADAFIGWYCDPANLGDKFLNEGSIKQQLNKKLSTGADDAALATSMQSYVNEAYELQHFDSNVLSDCAITCEIPDWLIREATPLNSSLSETATQSVANIVAAGSSIGINPYGNADSATVAAGIAASLEESDIGRRLISDIPTKVWTPNRDLYKRDLQNELTTEMNDMLTSLTPIDGEST